MASRTSTTKQIAERSSQKISRFGYFLLCMSAFLFLSNSSSFAQKGNLDELSLDKWKLLRETERYQLKIADKYFLEKNWKVAAAEYEKYLTLYEASEGAAYSQLRWSICLVNQRKLNTAIKEGFQSVIDYWPESEQAVAAKYFIGRTYKEMGEVRKAKKGT